MLPKRKYLINVCVQETHPRPRCTPCWGWMARTPPVPSPGPSTSPTRPKARSAAAAGQGSHASPGHSSYPALIFIWQIFAGAWPRPWRASPSRCVPRTRGRRTGTPSSTTPSSAWTGTHRYGIHSHVSWELSIFLSTGDADLQGDLGQWAQWEGDLHDGHTGLQVNNKALS